MYLATQVAWGPAATLATVSDAAVHDGFRHEALLYSGDREFLDRITAFVQEGLESCEPILVVLNQLCDLVQIRTLATSSAVRLHMRRPRQTPPA